MPVIQRMCFATSDYCGAGGSSLAPVAARCSGIGIGAGLSVSVWRGARGGIRCHGPRADRHACTASLPPQPTTLDDVVATMDETQLSALATEWGYEQLGTRLPDGLTLSVLSRAVPDDATAFSMKQLVLGVALPLSLMCAGYAWMAFMHSIIPGWQQAACWVLIGTGYFGLFSVAHDAARMALLPDGHELQNVLGSLVMAPSLYSLEAWRVSLLVHYAQPNMLGEDSSGWQPLTKARLAAMSALERRWAWLASTTPLKLFGSVSHWLSSWGGFNLKKYYPPMRLTMLGSWSVPFWFMAIAWPALIASGGLAAWFDCWLMPWLVFHFWLSTLTLLQHTAPHVPFEPPGPKYDAGQAAVNGTVTVALPAWLEKVINYANYHLPQHLAGGVPFYRAKSATASIEAKLQPFVNRARFNGRLLRNLVERWQVYDEDKRTYVTFAQAVAELDAQAVAAASASPAT